MHVSKLLLATSLWAFYTAATPKSTFEGPHTFDELRIALKALGIKGAEAIPAPPESLIESRATASSHLCLATVGTL